MAGGACLRAPLSWTSPRTRPHGPLSSTSRRPRQRCQLRYPDLGGAAQRPAALRLCRLRGYPPEPRGAHGRRLQPRHWRARAQGPALRVRHAHLRGWDYRRLRHPRQLDQRPLWAARAWRAGSSGAVRHRRRHVPRWPWRRPRRRQDLRRWRRRRSAAEEARRHRASPRQYYQYLLGRSGS